MKTMTERLQTFRRKWVKEDLGLPEIEEVLVAVTKAISKGVDIKTSPFALAAYYHLRIMAKSIRYKHAGEKPIDQHTTHLFIFSPDLCQVLVPQRGFFKRLFPGKKSISVCGHTDIAIDAINNEFQTVQLGAGQLISVDDFQGHLRSAEFIAFTQQEEERLQAAYEKHGSDYAIEEGLVIDYCQRKHSLFVYSLKKGNTYETQYQELIRLIEAEVQIEPYRSRQDHPSVTLYLYVLTAEEKEYIDKWITEHNKTREKAICSLKSEIEENHFKQVAKEVDIDEYAFLNWHDLLHEFKQNRSTFALDLCTPYLGDDAVIEKIETLLASTLPIDAISLDAPFARFRSMAGGKGSNLHLLRKLAEKTRKDCFEQMPVPWSVPGGIIISPFALYQCLEKNGLQGMVEKLDDATHFADALRQRISDMKIDNALSDVVWKSVQKLDSQILVVRSSSTGEDSYSQAGAGLAESMLGVPANKDDVLQAIKVVWASLYSRSFIEYRQQHGLAQHQARMAVVIQPMVEADAFGVMMSIDPKIARPGFWIGANHVPGGVVNSEDGDAWFVSPDARILLEKWPAKKASCLSAAQVLNLASIGKEIHESFASKGLARHVDIEFAVRKNTYFILQTRPVTTIDKTDPVSQIQNALIKTVDLASIPKTLPKVNLNGFGASSGVGVGRLQIVEDPFGFHTVEQDTILVTQNTNNDWNHVFKKIRGLITRRGNVMSHAATNARECGIPAIVGMDGAIDVLKMYDGQTVTLDAHLNRLYIGNAPVIEIPTPNQLWLNSDELTAITDDDFEEEESTGMSLWAYLQPFGQTFENAFGRWLGKPKRQYSYFQLDYYWRAWDLLRNTLNDMFPDKPPIDAPVKRIIVNRVLCFPITENEHSNFKSLMQALDLEDFEKLMRARWHAFQQAQKFMGNLNAIHENNARQVVELLENILSWMHLAFYFHWHFDQRFLQPQLRYVNPEYQHRLLELALHMAGDAKDVYRQNVLKEKYIELDAITAEIKIDPEQSRIFEQVSTAFIREDLYQYGGVWDKIEGLSRKYKHGSEDLRVASDTNEYLREFAGRTQGSYTVTDEQLIRYCQQYIEGDAPDEFEKIRLENHALYDLLLIHTGHDPRKIEDLIAKGQQHQRESHHLFEPILRRYPQMQRVLSLARQEAGLREDGHQLITCWQRKIRSMMLDCGRKAVAQNILRKPEEIFDLAVEEFVALVEYGFTQEFIGRSINRRKLLENAELELERRWTAANVMKQKNYTKILNGLCQNQSSLSSLEDLHQLAEQQTSSLWSRMTDEAIQKYLKDVASVINVLRKQSEEAKANGTLSLIDYYEEESRKIGVRVHELRRKIKVATIDKDAVFYPC